MDRPRRSKRKLLATPSELSSKIQRRAVDYVTSNNLCTPIELNKECTYTVEYIASSSVGMLLNDDGMSCILRGLKAEAIPVILKHAVVGDELVLINDKLVCNIMKDNDYNPIIPVCTFLTSLSGKVKLGFRAKLSQRETLYVLHLNFKCILFVPKFRI